MIEQRTSAVAIVGIGAILPGSPTARSFWRLVSAGLDATTEPPPGRWLLDPSRAYDPLVGRADRVYTTRGGFTDDEPLDVGDLAIDPALVARLDPTFRLALRTARDAWNAARTETIDRSRVGVIFGNIVLPTETTSSLTRETLGRTIEDALGVPPSGPSNDEPYNAFPAGLPASLVARALGFGGPAFTLDAACASSLYALKLACDELTTGRVDAMLAGGVSRPDALYTQMGFSQLRALSPRGRSAPFDDEGDGLIVGEGAGLFVLKRLDDAIRQGDVIHGVIRGIGLSNDLHGDLLAPSSEGQLRAMRAAYDQAGWSPDDVDLVECHATGTPVGDAVEVESLKALWSDHSIEIPGRCVIGSVKSNVGHMLTAAGAAGLLKVLLAIEHKVLPPTANHTNTSPRLGLDESPFRVLKTAEPWPPAPSGRPRRAAISGFGFGGINAHMLIEEWTGQPVAIESTVKAPASPSKPVAIVGVSAHFGPWRGLPAYQHRVLGGETDSKAGHLLDGLRVRVGRFRIPPLELESMLLQQSLMLQTAAEAIDDARWSSDTGLRTCVVVGLGLDLNTTNFQLRWWLTARAPEWNAELGWNLSPRELDDWIVEACDAIHPALSPNRTMGSLGGLVASRIAREFRIGGPSFTVSCDENSGLEALRVAADWLARGEVDSAVVGAVDLAGDERTARAAGRLVGASEPFTPGEGATALVLKRHADAVRDGDRIYAVIRDPRAVGVSLDSVRRSIGWTGAAEGLAAVAAAAVALDRAILPPSDAIGPRYWLQNREDGPRVAVVRQQGLGGLDQTIVLEGVDDPSRPTRTRSLGPHPRAIFAVGGRDATQRAARLAKLESLAAEDPSRPIETLARLWHQAGLNEAETPALALIAADATSLARAIRAVRDDRPIEGVEFFPPRLDWDGPPQVALTYPGLGNVFAGMGSQLSALWPELLGELESRYATVRDQFAPDAWWNGPLPTRIDDHRPAILGQISVGSLTTALFQKLGVKPVAAVGYSLGESAALVALGAWADRDDMLKRLMASPLFATDLAGPCSTARRAWGLADSEPVDWVAGIVPRSGDDVDAAIAGVDRVYVLIRNAVDESVIGGQGDAVRGVLQTLRCPFLPLPLVSTVHCEVGRAVESEYRALHELKTAPVDGVTFYSGVWGTAYTPDHETAAAAITAQAAHVIDFPRVVEKAYADGVRVFLEMGPGSSCTRLIGRILGDRPHLAVSACPAEGDALDAVLRALGELIAAGVPVDLGFLYDGALEGQADDAPGDRREIVIDRGRAVVGLPSAPRLVPAERVAEPDRPIDPEPALGLVDVFLAPDSPAAVLDDLSSMSNPIAHQPTLNLSAEGPSESSSPLLRQFLETQLAASRAHEAFLRLSQGFSESMGRQIALEFDLLDAGELPVTAAPVLEMHRNEAPPAVSTPSPAITFEPVALDRAQCLEFAIGSIGAVLGPAYAEIDSHPTRVRLPDEPLMLVDRILTIEGRLGSLTSGRVVTEHDVLPGAWYLDGGRIAPCVAIESGQADLFLAGYLGIDLITKGLAVYRLLDATVTFHRDLPAPGDVIRYDIVISSFFRQGETHLFRFGYDATVNGEPLMTMRDGCAGFFSEAALAAGKGIVPRPLDAKPRPGVRPDDWRDLTPSTPTTLDARQVDALRAGDLHAAFGSPFDQIDMADPLPLPGGRMTLVHRVETLDPRGGRFGLGLIRAEADIHPDDWFMVCHFVDDRVMPGTLMYECCQHTLRIFLMRLGWVGAADSVRYEPQTGVANRLQCRGQVVATTRTVTYEITIKELGYGPEPYAIADALMFADGKPIVEFTDMGLRLSGTTREELERLWEGARTSKLVYSLDQILAFSTGAPSDCFGERFRPFDSERFIARLPRPPYQFLDQVTILEGDLCVQAVGASAEAEYTVPPDAWYFDSDRQPHVPYAVLLEAVLQACGFVSAFMGSALTSDGPLKYRNLGGRGRQHRIVDRNSGTLRSSVRVVKINRSAGMLLHHFEMSIHDASGLVFDGDTYFGFFHPDALIDQVGVREAVPYELTDDERRISRSFPLPDAAPFPDRKWRMVEQVDAFVSQGGPNGLGFIEGSGAVDPGAWFFQAHFLGDPVWPGSLGLESLQQLLKVVAAERWDAGPDAVFDSPGLGVEHGWTYRGQIASTNRRVTTQAVITAVDDDRRLITADGLLRVDGKVIYQMSGFTLGLRSR
ncbi:beta-ketoacyl synthase N-terminal-like domain-containing protein [Paludisphaera borealis]|uniref:Polyketide synthase PksL n=1 Tax=Paludisphaera borealis TaxID=1387353 RepID=A0A1U7CVX0_9BACT|nr:beta-ketoacyl synthase N-terminal-like domain-containing protein [Paludisphaera borealis]APW63092.1 Polyketide synthase PksL [Paludisphaera borealis]